MQGVENAELVKEYPIKNSFKFDDIFNDLSVHTFVKGDEDFLNKLSEPDYEFEMSRKNDKAKKPFKILNRDRSAKKGIVVEGMEDLFTKGRTRFGYPESQKLTLVLEEDGTEIEDDEYLFSLPDNTVMVLIFDGDRWSEVNIGGGDEVDSKPQNIFTKLEEILVKLEQNPSRIALLSEQDLELLVDLDIHGSYQGFHRFSADFLKDIQKAAENHMIQKGQLRDTIGLLELYHQTNQANTKRKKT